MKASLVLALMALSFSLFAASIPQDYCIENISHIECHDMGAESKDCRVMITAQSPNGSKMLLRLGINDANIPGDTKIVPDISGNQPFYKFVESNGRLADGVKGLTNQIQDILKTHNKCRNFKNSSKTVTLTSWW